MLLDWTFLLVNRTPEPELGIFVSKINFRKSIKKGYFFKMIIGLSLKARLFMAVPSFINISYLDKMSPPERDC